MMRLNQPERSGIIVFEPQDGLFAIVSRLVGGDERICHVHDAAAFHAAIDRVGGSVSLMIALDETQPYDTLAVLEAHREEPWLAQAVSLVVAR